MSAARLGSESEALAKALYEALRAYEPDDVFIEGSLESRSVLIDGDFDLYVLAQEVLRRLKSQGI